MAGIANIKDEFNQSDIDLIEDDINGLGGAGTHGQVILTAANTWKQVPESGAVPTSAYILMIAPEGAGTDGAFTGTVRLSYSNSSTPAAARGLRFKEKKFLVELKGGEVVYFGSTNATDAVNYTTKII